MFAYLSQDAHNYGERDYDEGLVALNKYDGSERWALSKDDAPVGPIRAISGETIYVNHDGDLVALREETDEENEQQNDSDTEEDDSDDDPAEDKGGSGSDDGESVNNDDGDVGSGNAGNGDAGNETTTENNTDTDNVPGFTIGGGLLGGALGLEWLRRKAGVDESTSVNEPSE